MDFPNKVGSRLMLLTAWLPGPHFRGQFIVKALKENIQKSKNPLVQQVELGILEQHLRMKLQIIIEKGTTSVDHFTFDRILFDPGQLWLISDFGSIRYHWIDNDSHVPYSNNRLV